MLIDNAFILIQLHSFSQLYHDDVASMISYMFKHFYYSFSFVTYKDDVSQLSWLADSDSYIVLIFDL